MQHNVQTWMHFDYLPPMVLKHHLFCLSVIQNDSEVWYMCILKMALCFDIISDKQKVLSWDGVTSLCGCSTVREVRKVFVVCLRKWKSFHFNVKGVNFSTWITFFSHDFVYPYDFEAFSYYWHAKKQNIF